MSASETKTVEGLRARRGRETRAAILTAAERVFAEGGLDGARTDAITAAAGVNKALLYYYFRGKDALYCAVIEALYEEFYRREMAVLSGEDCVRSTLLRFVTIHFDFIAARPYYPRLFHWLLMTGGRPLERLGRKYLVPLSRKLVKVIERGVRRGELRPADSHHTALSLVALTVFYFSAAPVVKIIRHVDPYERAQLARRKQEVLDFIRYGLFRNPEARLP